MVCVCVCVPPRRGGVGRRQPEARGKAWQRQSGPRVCGRRPRGRAARQIETSEEGDAEWKEYRPRIEPDGRSFQDELVTIKGTRKQLMERLAKLFVDWSPHDWIDRWNTHARHLTYVPLCTHPRPPPSLTVCIR